MRLETASKSNLPYIHYMYVQLCVHPFKSVSTNFFMKVGVSNSTWKWYAFTVLKDNRHSLLTLFCIIIVLSIRCRLYYTYSHDYGIAHVWHNLYNYGGWNSQPHNLCMHCTEMWQCQLQNGNYSWTCISTVYNTYGLHAGVNGLELIRYIQLMSVYDVLLRMLECMTVRLGLSIYTLLYPITMATSNHLIQSVLLQDQSILILRP